MSADSKNLTPQAIVAELNRFIIGQLAAKKAVAIALRNRWRRKQVPEPLRDEIVPKNILMIGPTGVGKTEIARRLAKLANAPFIKIEATKFTEVGYVGRDVDSIIRDLVEISINIIRQKLRKEVYEKAKNATEERILDTLVGDTASLETREKFKTLLQEGKLQDKEIEIQVKESAQSMPTFDIPGIPGGQMGVINVGEMLNKTLGLGGRTKNKKMTVLDAYGVLMAEESDKLLDEDKIISQAIDMVENEGIVFIDEIDKIAARYEAKGGEVSREGVQRDLLPLIEGTTVSTKYGSVKTDYILFIASGAFHMAKPSDLLPELQGRLPIRVELKALTHEDMVSILKEPETSLLKQYEALLATENINLTFTTDGINELARIATIVNQDVENIGARRLHTILEKLLDEISFNASEESGAKIVIDEQYVKNKLDNILQYSDLSKFIL
ncbi:ATP-dependent protease ATPase subunit HslU [Rickettsiales bacterium Ac37b]|nr:ATP-dependent protease ATPase subunit HslU [Rickettsiales bacterium Ac37b]